VKGQARQPRFATLTSREREVLKLLAEGRENRGMYTCLAE
jgi:DNA-binding NarL/FixJ family response regulator